MSNILSSNCLRESSFEVQQLPTIQRERGGMKKTKTKKKKKKKK